MVSLRVGIDLDGVLYNFGDSCRRYLEATDQGHLWKSGPTPEPYWEFYKDWGWDANRFVEFCNAGVDAGYIFSGPIRDNAVEAVNSLVAEGHEIIIITDRQFGSSPKNSHRATMDWLAEHGIWFDELIFSADKTCVPTDVFVEDKPENHLALLDAGTESFIINRPWNVSVELPNRINDISEYPAKVREYAMTQSVV